MMAPPKHSFPPIPQFDLEPFFESSQRVWSEPFTFVHMADPQFGLIEKYYLEKENPKWDVEIGITKAAIRQINRLSPKPKFVMIGGDMLDTRPGTVEEKETRNAQYDDFVECCKLLDPEIKIVVCAGNHDVGDIPTIETIRSYHQQFGPDIFSFWFGGVKFSVLNTQYWKSPQSLPEHFRNQHTFLETIPDPWATHLIVFQHIPFFISDPDEEDVGYLNIEKVHRFPVMDILDEIGVKHVFCGHYHRNGHGTYKGLEQIITTALCKPLGEDPPGFRIVTVDKKTITNEYVALENLD